MTIRKIAILYLLALAATTATYGQKRECYEFRKNMPVYCDSLIADMTYPLAWGQSKHKNFGKWKREARKKVFECMMTPPAPSAGGWQTKVLAEEQREGYHARLLEFRLSKYYSVRAYLLVPDGGGKHPAVNLLHDHGAHLFIGKEKMIRPFAADSAVIKDADEWQHQVYGGQYWGDFLARNGYVVLSADAPMWGDRGRAEGVDRSKYDIVAGNMMMYGRCLSAWMTYDDLQTTELLASLPEVDDSRVAVAGCSMGAYRAWMVAALSDRVKAVAAVCWMITSDVQLTTRYGRGENGGFANCIPALRQWMDYPHIASLACPMPAIFISGRQDKLFPVPGVEKAFGIMQDVWNSQHAGNRLITELWDMPHGCPPQVQQRVLMFFNENL